MPHYKDQQNRLHFLDSTEHEYMLPAGCVPITDEEAAILSAPPQPTVQQRRDAVQAQIDALERTQIMPRITREALLLLAVQTGASMGLTEPEIYAVNIGYHKLKDFDNTIVALRAQKDSIA
ncbi:MAG: hypothetical protein KGK17_04815 [Betaproteobacteria bacterium]|nr:hypothetical protein [Betaproteobacteria bacterium]